MEKTFEIGRLDRKKKQAIVYSTNYLRLEEYMDEVARLLKEQSFKGDVIFDLLLSNGNSFNRFIEIFFNGEKFEKKTIKVLNNISEDLINLSLDFYSSNLSLLDNSILSKAQKFLIKKKYAF